MYKRQDIIFAVGYKGSMVEEYFGDGSGFTAPDGTPITVHYAYEEELLGTAGAIKNAGRFVTEDSFFVLNADTFYQIDYSRLVTMQQESDLDMALVLREVPDISRYGAAVLMNGRLTGFNEKLSLIHISRYSLPSIRISFMACSFPSSLRTLSWRLSESLPFAI